MSVLSRYLAWFTQQGIAGQFGSTIVLFAAFFAFGVYTLGLGPLVVIGLILVDHWYRG